jgi:hypothetical protein
MGYTTDFSGKFKLNKQLTLEHSTYLKAFSETRRMCRNAALVAELPDHRREAVGLPVGPDGGYYVGAIDLNNKDICAGQDFKSPNVTNSNSPPQGQPGLWCQWVPTEDDDGIEWNGGEKFYEYVEWLEYLIENFLKPWGYVLNGTVFWYGEDHNDRGKIFVLDNEVNSCEGRIVYADED